MADENSPYPGMLDLQDFVKLTFSSHGAYAGVSNPGDTASKLINKVLSSQDPDARSASLSQRCITSPPNDDVKFVKWTGDRSNYRRLMTNTALKAFVAKNVKTPISNALVDELCAVHSLAEAAVQPPGSLEEASALSGTDTVASAIGVAFVPTAPSLTTQPQHQLSELNLMAIPEERRTAEMTAFLREQARARREENDQREKRNRVEALAMAKSLLVGIDDDATSSWMQRESKNLAMMLVKSSNGGSSSSDGQLALTGGGEEAPPTPDNPFLWTCISRADYLGVKVAKVNEAKIGRYVSDKFLGRYGGRPFEVNRGKIAQQDATGVARSTNCFTEEQCREVVDRAIREWQPPHT
jgi:hypothetical protein